MNVTAEQTDTMTSRTINGTGRRPAMDDARRDAWGPALQQAVAEGQRAAANLEALIEGALNDNCQMKWIAEQTGAHYKVIQRIRDEGPATSWQHPRRSRSWEGTRRRFGT